MVVGSRAGSGLPSLSSSTPLLLPFSGAACARAPCQWRRFASFATLWVFRVFTSIALGSLRLFLGFIFALGFEGDQISNVFGYTRIFGVSSQKCHLQFLVH